MLRGRRWTRHHGVVRTTVEQHEILVRARWRAALAVVGGDPALVDEEGDDLVARWSAPARRYHDLAHAAEVLAVVSQLAARAGLSTDEHAVVDLAACAHDVVYEGRPGEDEEDSARWLEEATRRAGVAEVHVGQAAALVRATAGHAGPADTERDLARSVLLDADLAVLARPPEAYDAYLEAVRAEYAHLDDTTWRRGRAQVLRGLLGRDRLYDLLGEDAETRARTNLARELAGLG